MKTSVKPRSALWPILLSFSLLVAGAEGDRCLVPASILDPILNEISGEEALRHVEILSVDRNRQEEEYLDRFMETAYLEKMTRQYGFSDIKVDFFPAGRIWDPEEAELWITDPVKKKIAGLEIIPEALASGSASADVEAELVYAGAGREADLQGKEVAGKLLLVNGPPAAAFANGVLKLRAAGVLAIGSPGTMHNAPGFSLDQIGWQSVNPGGEGRGFAFVLSQRQFDELRGYLDTGRRVTMRAHVKTRMYPYKMNVISASIPGTDPGAGELLFVAHLFERIATPGANDNTSGVANILEIGRTLAKLIAQGALPRPKRTMRFLWVPEISGSREFMYKYPELESRLLAVLNFDMTGADLEATDTYLRMKMTPDSVPSYLNDLIADLLRFVDQTDIRTQWGNNGIFNYRLCPYIAGSDHTVFLPAGIPAMQFNHWPDNYYHSSEDRARYVDATELKRIGFVAASAFYYLAGAGGREARDLAWECAANGVKWIAEVARQSVRLLGDSPAALHEGRKAAQIKIDGALGRGKGAIESVLALASVPEVSSTVRRLTANLEKARDVAREKLEYLYAERCAALGVRPQPLALSDEEKQYERLVPRKLFRHFSQEHRSREARVAEFLPKEGLRLSSLARSEVPNFIDGKRSVLEIYRAVRAEYGNVDTGSSEHKFAYVVKPDAPDVPLQAVVDLIRAMEKAGLLEFR